MAKTNWQDPKSTEVISPHISGLQEAIGKLEESLGISSTAGIGIALTEVYISETDRYRIYQAPEGNRNWLSSPTPIIKKNGAQITTGFNIEYGGGAVVFTTPLLSADVVTADATYTVKEATDIKAQIKILAHPSFCSIKKTTNQSVPNSSYTKLTFDSETLDTNNMFDVASNTRITIKEAGIYLVVGTISYAINATGFRQSEIAKNGVVVNDAIVQSVASVPTSVVCTAILNCATNDYIELFGRQNSGGALDVVQGTNLMVVKVGEV